MDAARQVQTLVVLGEERVARRMAEDRIESLELQVQELTRQLADSEDKVESLTSEKRVLMADVSELREELEAKKEQVTT